MAKAGFEVLMMDSLGHGQSGGTKGLLSSYKEIVDDAVLYVNKVIELYPGLPVILSGESMGGTVALGVSVQVHVDGMFLFNPAFSSKFASDNSFWSLLGYFCPTLALPYPPPSDKVSSRNAKVLGETYGSGMVFFDFMMAGSVKAMFLCMDQAFSLANLVTTPLVIVAGGRDYVIEEARVKRFYEEVRSDDKEYWFYPDLHHMVLYEPEYPEIQRRLVEW
eukprot:CAMPEP_0204902380 /NCGR_PEP_ID=MMETSP1397-20131031/3633_1 /ASSEMBLY_ACC=CAM_ASM_000891 /TAXON_ID=49980 /ORGANISM="Climacostomum Climacostomum virens, Strain Stock W-24" /LENGTH=219 /DNA_ID=CAMNT_0052070875 /DNA_START=219 /DNA_END=875 /DNA_ORIENTATION=+